jgi:hypothetical protein
MALLCNDREIDGYIRPVSGQRLGKHVPAATAAHATEETWCFCVVRAGTESVESVRGLSTGAD